MSREAENDAIQKALDPGRETCKYCGKPIEDADLEFKRIISRNWKSTGFKSPPRPYHKSKGCAGYDQMAHEG